MAAKKKNTSPAMSPVLTGALLLASIFLLSIAGTELFSAGWGSGQLLGRLSLKWLLTLGLYLFAALAIAALFFLYLYRPQRVLGLRRRILPARNSLGGWRWLLVAFVSVIPAYFIFYSPWGRLFLGLGLRTLVFLLSLWLGSLLITRAKEKLTEFPAFLLAGLSIGTWLVLAEAFVLVSSYPFALHWSEGNRLWDYSLLFGRELYNYPLDQNIPALIDQGRQSLWGLPFIVPGVPIWAVRLWGAILVTLPYAVLGWIAFRPQPKARGQWLAAGFWALLFLNQGPIYTPLVLAAILVAFARRKPLWLALPLVFIAGHYAGLSRYTWIFAPGIYAFVLSLGDAVILHHKLTRRDWLRAAALGLAGIWSKGLPVVLGVLHGLLQNVLPRDTIGIPTPQAGGSIESLEGLQATATNQPLLWYRLFPNEVYPPGIILGLAIATLPLILLLIHLHRRGYWKTVQWQRIFTLIGLAAFLVVGVIASAKVGGGTDLHNLDMFLVGLVLIAGLAWEAGLHSRLGALLRDSRYVRALLAAMILLPAFMPMFEGKPLKLPDDERTEFVLARIQAFTACARQHGEVLFMDQRQLITFGHMGDLPLVADYEKKVVMNEALASNAEYFEQFNADLESGRFALIVTERQAILYKDTEGETIGDSLNEENNAWVDWVTVPLLQHYESVGEYRDAAVELFMPIERDFDCP
jgi:hypothetical protein